MRKGSFSNWSLSTQLQLLFTLAIIILSSLIVLITRLQLDWIGSDAHSLSYSVLEENNLARMRLLIKSESKFISTEYKSFIKLVKNLKSFNLLASDNYEGIAQPFADRAPLWVEDADRSEVYYNTSFYCSKLGEPNKDSLAYETVFNTSRLDYIVPILYKKNYFYIYEGFKEYEILNSYPGEYFGGYLEYTPLVREWYHTAKNNPNWTIITEPYTDATTGNWIFTISHAISVNNSITGVAALDISLAEITNAVKDITILKTGYVILVTKSGMILTKPKSWNTDETVRIYDESQTGFTYDQWSQIIAAEQGDDFQVNDVNKTDFTLSVGFVKPYETSENITHYALLMAETKQIYKPVDDLDKNFAYIKNVLFWTVIACELCVVIIGASLIYCFSKNVKAKLDALNKILVKINRRAVYSNLTKKVKFDKLEKLKSGIEKAVDACQYKVEVIKAKEEKFGFYKWGKNRPWDYDLYCKWIDDIYPFSKFNEVHMGWNEAVERLKGLKKFNGEEDSDNEDLVLLSL